MYRGGTSLLPVGVRNRLVSALGTYPFGELPEEAGTLFPRLFGWLPPFYGEAGAANRWEFNVTEGEKEIVVYAELPGFEEKELSVTLHENMLTITAAKTGATKAERESFTFRRVIAVPVGLDATKINAVYRNGVLELHIPKPEGLKPKHIAIKVE